MIFNVRARQVQIGSANIMILSYFIIAFSEYRKIIILIDDFLSELMPELMQLVQIIFLIWRFLSGFAAGK